MLDELPPAGAGVGLKPRHFREVLEQAPPVGFFEVHAENHMVAGGWFHHVLGRVRERYPLALHGVALSLGGPQRPDPEHLDRLRELVRRYQPAVFSEHLAWSRHGGRYLNDLLPVAYDRDTLQRVCDHIDETQRHLGRRLLLENPSTYLQFEAATMSEAQFMAEVVRRTGCGLLLDVNNLYVSAVNHGADPGRWLDEYPLQAVRQVHLAGFSRDRDAAGATLLIDSHGGPVDAAVWALHARALARMGPVPTLIEWDHDVPTLPVLLQEARLAQDQLDAASAAATLPSECAA